MADYFFDSSALVKAYIAETGTDWVRTILDDPLHRISVSALAEVEVVSALTRRFTEGHITRDQFDFACDELSLDCTTFVLVEVTDQIVNAAVASVRKHSLRAYDAVQLASALAANAALLAIPKNPTDLTLVSADNALNNAATQEVLRVENPNLY